MVYDIRYYYVVTAVNAKGESPASLQIEGLSLFDHSGATLCASCHTNLKPATHPPTTNDCDACHISTLTWVQVVFDHNAAIGTCSSCHNSTPRPANHIPTSSDCNVCHTSTASWTQVIVDHNTFIATPCVTCHNSITATGKPAAHVLTTSDCNVCHNTTTWLSVN